MGSFIIYTRENYLAVLPLTFLLLSVQGKSEIPVKFKTVAISYISHRMHRLSHKQNDAQVIYG